MDKENEELLTRGFVSYRMLKEALETTNIQEDEEAVMVTRMKVDPRHVVEFEKLLRMILRNTHSIGHVSTCVVKPPAGENTYTSIVKYSSLDAMKQVYPSTVESGVDFYKLLATRDSLLMEPPTYQIEAGFGTWIESDGNTKPMRHEPEDDDNQVYKQMPGTCCNDSCENPHGLNVFASFVVPSKGFKLFQPRYQRNNKKGGQKNLRCFPCCRHGRHVSSGFCGDSVRVHVAVNRITSSGGVKICPIQPTHPALSAYARFLNLDGVHDESVSGPEVFPGQTIEKEELLRFVRDRNHPMNPLFPGVLRGAAMENSLQSALFEFNSECKAWHYGWTAPRGQGLSGSDAQHVLEVIFMKPLGSYLYCLERLRSDSFSIYSSRRASNTAKNVETPDTFENEDDDDSRMSKRKRPQMATSLAVVLPPPSTPPSAVSTPSSVSSSSPESRTPGAYSPAQSTASSVTSTPQHSAFKVESQYRPQARHQAPGFHPPAPSNANYYNQHPHQHHQQQQQQHHRGPTSTVPVVEEPMEPMEGMESFLDPEHELMHNSIFNELPPRRVVANEEIPWSELYNLFDAPMASLDGKSMPGAGGHNAQNTEEPMVSYL